MLKRRVSTLSLQRSACNFAKHCKHHEADRSDLGSSACTPHCIYEYLQGQSKPTSCLMLGDCPFVCELQRLHAVGEGQS